MNDTTLKFAPVRLGLVIGYFAYAVIVYLIVFQILKANYSFSSFAAGFAVAFAINYLNESNNYFWKLALLGKLKFLAFIFVVIVLSGILFEALAQQFGLPPASVM